MPVWEKVLVCTAHMDDMEWFCGATVAQLCAQGSRVTLAILTEEQPYVPVASLQEFQQQRKAQQHQAAQVLGLQTVCWLDLAPEGKLALAPENQRKIADLIQETTPDLLLTFAPTVAGEHGVAGHRVAQALQSFPRIPVLTFQSTQPNYFWPVTWQEIEKAQQALAMHQGRFQPRTFTQKLYWWASLTLRPWWRGRGSKTGWAEGFHQRPCADLMDYVPVGSQQRSRG
ncbi:PIG-L deacetylase family protein [Anthocerotibacter panamensis]|uniref:PIG-L deacetylase family protein n=1 Tax=Anthocerotibacter panamensis TaxID=2857077 RepID=UPI001C405AAF|nr:PIG-L family deacetylase [Anthocerotibacter panamensis]